MIEHDQHLVAEEARTEPEPQPEPQRLRAGFREWQAFVAAVQFLTRVPIDSGVLPAAPALARSPVYFPLVGALIGLFTSSATALAVLVWPPWIAVVLALALEAVLTGALHEDAVADFCDAFGGGRTRDQILTILADSRVGAFGALGLIFAISIRAAALFTLIGPSATAGSTSWAAAMVASSALGRYAMVIAMVLVPPIAGRESLARSVGGGLSGWVLVASGLWIVPALLPFAVLMPVQFIGALAFLLPSIGVLMLLVRRKLGGMTGDCLGCIGYVGQVVVLLAAVARK